MRPRAMTFVPMGNSTGINADGALRGDVADDQPLAVQTSFSDRLEQGPVGGPIRQDLAISTGDKRSAVAALQGGVRNGLDRHHRVHLNLLLRSVA